MSARHPRPGRSFRRLARGLLAAGLVLGQLGSSVQADRVKDLATLDGVRDNQLVGYGLVVGLDGTGGGTEFTVQSLRSMLNRLGVRVPPGVSLSPKNVAAVALHATLPPFAKPGQRLDVTVSTLGDARSLRGGSLLISPLKGLDGNIYAIAQGSLVVGGFGASTSDGNSISVNIPTAGRIPNGAVIERPAPTELSRSGTLIFNLHHPDFTTAQRLADAINKSLGGVHAQPVDATAVQVTAPRDPSQQVGFVSVLENLELDPGEAPARVIVNARTGTVVIGQHVEVSAAAVAHGNLSVTVSNITGVSQPAPLSTGETVVVPNSEISVQEENSRAFLFQPGITLEEIVRAINQVGAAPSDLVAILEALRAAGALRAELIVI